LWRYQVIDIARLVVQTFLAAASPQTASFLLVIFVDQLKFCGKNTTRRGIIVPVKEKNMIWCNILLHISYTFPVFFSASVVCLAKML